MELARKILIQNEIEFNNDNFKELKKLVSDKIGYIDIFTHFYFNENIPISNLRSLLNDLTDLKPKLKELPPINNFVLEFKNSCGRGQGLLIVGSW